MNNNVLIIGSFLAGIIGRLEPELEVHTLWTAADPEAFLREVGGCIRAVATDAFSGASADILRHLPNVEVIANFGVGYDTIDVDYATAHGIKITNTPDVLNDDVADLAIALMLAVMRRVAAADRFVRAGGWPDGPFPLTTRLSGKRLGIVGLGRIGKAVARRATGFEMDIAYHGRHEQPDQPYCYYGRLTELARDADILVILVPETPATRALIDGDVLAALGEHGILINVARGPVVDETALVAALTRGRLGGAGLDVFANEPHVPAEFFTLDSVVMTPHVGSATHETRAAMADLVVGNLQAFFRGEPLLTPVGR